MCTKEYNDVAKVCPLEHCPNCGSLNVKQHRIRKFVENSVGNIIMISMFLFVFVGWFGILPTINSSLEMRVIPFAIAAFGGYVIYYFNTRSHYNCKDCQNRGFSCAVEIKLKKHRIKKEDMKSDEIEFKQEEITQKLNDMSKTQVRHNRRSIIIRIIGIVSGAIVSVLGIVFQEDLLAFFNN